MASFTDIAVFVTGIAAGSLVTLSSVPQILANRARRSSAGSQSIERSFLQGTGNGLWFVYGLWLSAWPLVVFAGLSVALTAWLIVQQVRARSPGRSARAGPVHLPLASREHASAAVRTAPKLTGSDTDPHDELGDHDA